jgi:hypothetical protein
VGVAQSQRLTTRLRSTPWGRSGVAAGSSPAAMRSVQSAKRASARGAPSRPRLVVICVIAWPETTRRLQASTEESNWPSSFGIVRVALLPS